MARHTFRKRTVEANIDMTPMLDIVFIMLIFFIVTATFLDEHGLDLTQPIGNSDPLCDCGPSVRVHLFEDGSVSVDGIEANIGNVLSRIYTSRADKPAATIFLSADKAAPYGNLVSLKDQFDKHGIMVILNVYTQ